MGTSESTSDLTYDSLKVFLEENGLVKEAFTVMLN